MMPSLEKSTQVLLDHKLKMGHDGLFPQSRHAHAIRAKAMPALNFSRSESELSLIADQPGSIVATSRRPFATYVHFS
jgi:hypothetical protein